MIFHQATLVVMLLHSLKHVNARRVHLLCLMASLTSVPICCSRALLLHHAATSDLWQILAGLWVDTQREALLMLTNHVRVLRRYLSD